MSGVPNEPVVAEVEGLMQGEAQLDDAQVRREVGAAASDEVAQHLAHLAGKLLKLNERELLEIGRLADGGQEFHRLRVQASWRINLFNVSLAKALRRKGSQMIL
jgi:hypothetical protein